MQHTLSVKIMDSMKRGKNRLTPDAVAHLSDYIKSQMLPDQSFMNKSGKSDLYYTLFGWMLCWVLQIKLDTLKMKAYLTQHDEDGLDLVHYASLKRCWLIYRILTEGKLSVALHVLKGKKIKGLNEFKQIPHNDFEAPYTQYLWVSLQEDTGNRTSLAEQIVKSLAAYKTKDGGYLNVVGGTAATTNATVAALAVSGQLNGFLPNSTTDYLRRSQNKNGGFAVAASSPMPDLLSTATALFILHCYGIKPQYPAWNFIVAHWLGSGGFAATLDEDKSDVEYCFYGLLALGCA
jgi:hypothetical protein